MLVKHVYYERSVNEKQIWAKKSLLIFAKNIFSGVNSIDIAKNQRDKWSFTPHNSTKCTGFTDISDLLCDCINSIQI